MTAAPLALDASPDSEFVDALRAVRGTHRVAARQWLVDLQP